MKGINGQSLVVASAVGALFIGGFALFNLLNTSMPKPRQVNWEQYQEGPIPSLSVYWVGHSLVNSTGDPGGSQMLIDLMGDFATSQGKSYERFDHTLFGSPLALLWRGSPHSYKRIEPTMVEKRKELEERGSQYNSLVLTDTIPIGNTEKADFSSYYLQQFYCTFLRVNPKGRVYLYESWPHFQASNREPWANYPLPSSWRWEDRIKQDRVIWERIADEAMTGKVPSPILADRFTNFIGLTKDQCEAGSPIFIIPVATVMASLSERLKQPHSWVYQGQPLAMFHFFVNPYIEWPQDWPLKQPLSQADTFALLNTLPKRFPDQDWDDVHPSTLGVYLATVVSYAVLYRDSPVGLPAPEGMPESTARGIQSLVWEMVKNDPRTGLKG